MDNLQNVLGQDLYKAVMGKTNVTKLLPDDGKLIPKYRFDCVNLSLKEHKHQVLRLTEENERLQSIVATLEETKTENLILNALSEVHFKSIKAARSFINTDGVTNDALNDCVKKQIMRLKKTEPYLFWDEEQQYVLVPAKNFSKTEKKA